MPKRAATLTTLCGIILGSLLSLSVSVGAQSGTFSAQIQRALSSLGIGPSTTLPTAVATGSVLVSNGVGAAPVYSASPTLTSVTLADLIASGTVIGIGGTSSSFPGIKNNSGTLEFRLADDSNYANTTGLSIVGTVKGSFGPTPATTGVVNIGDGRSIARRNHANSADANIVTSSSVTNDDISFGDVSGITRFKGTAFIFDQQPVGYSDGAFSRLGAASLALGNGTNGDFTGTLKLATVNATTALQLNGVDIVSAQTCSNTAASTDVTGTASKTYFSLNCKVPANALAAGDTIQFKIRGLYSGNVTDTMTMTVEACQVSGCASGTKVTLATTGALTLTAVSNQAFLIDEDLVTFTTGTSGTIDTQGYAQYETASTTAIIDSTPNTTTATVATNVDEYLSVSVTFSSSSGNNHASIRNLIGVIQ